MGNRRVVIVTLPSTNHARYRYDPDDCLLGDGTAPAGPHSVQTVQLLCTRIALPKSGDGITWPPLA